MTIYRLSLQHNDTYAFREHPTLTENQKIHQAIVPDMSGATHPGLRRCEACGELLAKWEEPLNGVVVKRRKYDIGATYDGLTLVSIRFKAAYEAAGLTGLIFRQLPDDADFYAILPHRSVAFDAERRKTRFLKPCAKCNRFESVVGATPVYLKLGTQIGPREFVRTDLEFASGDEKHPLILCGGDAAESLNSAKLKGLDLEPIQ